MMDAEERHQRRLMLMRMEGDLARAEHRNHIRWLVAVALAVLALIFMSV